MTRRNLTSRIGETLWRKRHPQWAGGHPDRVNPQLTVSARDVPRYAFDQLAIRARQKVRGQQPWITRESLMLLDQMLHANDRGLEYGAGGTTAWFAERVEFVDSVEGFPQWYQPLRDDLDQRGITNVDLHLVSADELGYETPEHRAAYVGVNPELAPASLEFVFVDGEYRDECALRAIGLLRSGGLLILDNAETYLPTHSRSPWQLDEPATELWKEFVDQTADWRRIWTTNGVWDTALWIKP